MAENLKFEFSNFEFRISSDFVLRASNFIIMMLALRTASLAPLGYTHSSLHFHPNRCLRPCRDSRDSSCKSVSLPDRLIHRRPYPGSWDRSHTALPRDPRARPGPRPAGAEEGSWALAPIPALRRFRALTSLPSLVASLPAALALEGCLGLKKKGGKKKSPPQPQSQG